MKKLFGSAFMAFAFLLSPVFSAPARCDANIQVSVNLPLPPLVIPAPPLLLPIPGAYVYYPPEVGEDIFWYRDRWYRPHAGKWYKAKHHNGPWNIIHKKHVPSTIIGIPPTFRVSTARYERLPYQEVRLHHREWENNRRWDKIEDQKHDKGESRKNNGGRKNDRKNDRHKPDRNNHKGR